MKKLPILALLILCCAGLARATTYYFAANGSNSNTGTKLSPCLYAPGMPNFPGSGTCHMTPAAGDSFIFRGGDTWHLANLSDTDGSANVSTGGVWAWAWSGTGLGSTCNFAGGSTSTCIYIGVDTTWYNSAVCGASFCRPQLNEDNPTWSNSSFQDTAHPGFVTSCPYPYSTATVGSGRNGISIGSSSGIIVDDINEFGKCWESTPPSTGCEATDLWIDAGANRYDTVIDSYFHGWTETYSPAVNGATANDFCSILGGNPSPGASHDVYHDNVIDGSDSNPASTQSTPGVEGYQGTVTAISGNTTITWASGDKFNPAWASGQLIGISGIGCNAYNDGSSCRIQSCSSNTVCTLESADTPTASGGFDYLVRDSTGGPVLYGDCYDFAFNVVRWIANTCAPNYNAADWHDNLLEYDAESYDPADHSEITEAANPPNDCPPYNQSYYNNVFRHDWVGITVEISTCTGYSTYIFNNVFWDVNHGPDALILDGTQTPAANVYLTNNTFDQLSLLDASDFQVRFQSGNAGINVTSQNNHLIGGYTSPLNSSSNLFNGTTTGTVTDNGNEVFQTESVANGQGYTASNNYQPTASGNATVHAGGNLSTSCTTYSSDSALCNGSTGGVTNTAGSGTIPTLYIASPPARGTTFDSGAYQFSGVAPSTPVAPAPWFAESSRRDLVGNELMLAQNRSASRIPWHEPGLILAGQFVQFSTTSDYWDMPLLSERADIDALAEQQLISLGAYSGTLGNFGVNSGAAPRGNQNDGLPFVHFRPTPVQLRPHYRNRHDASMSPLFADLTAVPFRVWL